MGTPSYEALTPEQRLQALSCLLGNENLSLCAFDREGTIFYADGKGLDTIGLKASDLVGTSVFHQPHDDPSNIEACHRALRGEAFMTRAGFMNATYEVRFTPVRDAAGEVREVWSLSLNVTESEKLARERAFLLEASKALSQSLDYKKTLEQVARLTVGAFADYSLIRLLDDAGDLELAAFAHVDPTKEDAAFELSYSYATKNARTAPGYQVIESGKSAFAPTINAKTIAAAGLDAREHAALRTLDPCSSIMSPLTARGQILGVISFVCTGVDSGRHYTDEDVRFAEEIASRAGLAIDNARLYQKATGANL